MDEKTTDPAGKGPARRRLLRGTFAAPAVLTLVSGSALAATSLSCVAKLNLHPVNAGPDPAGNVWIRVPVWQKLNTNNGKLAQFVAGSEIGSLLPPGGSYIGVGIWQCIKNTFTSGGFTVGSTYTTYEVDSTKPTLVKAKVPNLYVAVRVDSTGKIVGVEPISTSNSAMSVSCWTSFGGANPYA